MAGEIPPGSGGAPPPAAAKPAVRAFQCPACGAALRIKAVGQTITVGCTACGSTLDTSREDVQLIEKGRVLQRRISIPLGSRARFDGAVYETIGVMERFDRVSRYVWREYLLYNPFQGFRWLSEADGQWSFVYPLKEAPKIDDAFNFTTGAKPRAILGDRTYTHFQTTDAEVNFVVGEFYWRVRKGDRAQLRDYVDPPSLLSCEVNGTERIWSRCEYVKSADLERAFRLGSKLPAPIGVAPNQPNPHRNRWEELRSVWFMFTTVILCLFAFHRATVPNRRIFTERLDYRPAGAFEKAGKVGPFELDGGGNLELEVDTDVYNGYFDLDVDLVNDRTGESHDLQLGTEYWAGYDSDGSWTEGSRHSSDLESGIGPGTYHLNLTPTSGSGTGAPIPVTYTLAATRGVPVGSNLLLAWILISLVPLWSATRSSAFESERWANSDYAPADDE